MEIAPKEAAEVLGVAVPTLRRWSKHFARFLSSQASPQGGRHRSYTEEDLAMLARAKGLLEAGLTYERVAEMLSGEEVASAAPSSAPPAEQTILVPTPTATETRQLAPASFQEVLVRALELASQRNDELGEALQVIAEQKNAIHELEGRVDELELKAQQAGSSREMERLRTRLDILEKWQGRSWLSRLFGWW